MAHLQTKNFLIAIVFDYTSWEKITWIWRAKPEAKTKKAKKDKKCRGGDLNPRTPKGKDFLLPWSWVLLGWPGFGTSATRNSNSDYITEMLKSLIVILSDLVIRPAILYNWNYGSSSDSGAQCLCTHFPDMTFEISLPALIGASHSEQVVLNLAFMNVKDIR